MPPMPTRGGARFALVVVLLAVVLALAGFYFPERLLWLPAMVVVGAPLFVGGALLARSAARGERAGRRAKVR